jgi:guanylate kinase
MSNDAEDAEIPTSDAWAGRDQRAVGLGESTLVRRLLARPALRLTVSVSATTRHPRPGEVPDRDYIFLAPDQFEQIRGELLEFAQVHDQFYGTPAEPVRRAMTQGLCVLLVIDVQGASNP